jgi:hypothetical protein
LEAQDFIKAAILLFLYLVAGPALGFLIQKSTRWQRIFLGLICFMAISGILHPSEWGLTVANNRDYRGHARGFHFYFAEIFAVALIVAAALNRRSKFRLLPPGLWVYLFYCALSLLSLFSAPAPIHVFEAALKAFKIILIFIAAWNFFKTEEDVHFFLKAMTWTMTWEMMVVLKMKYVDHIYQVWGTFEHQNSLCMFATMIGLVLLAVGTGPKHRSSNLYLWGFLACAVVVESTLSRGGLVIFGGGTVAVLVLSLLDKITMRRVLVISGLGLVGVLGLAMAINTILARFNDKFNSESNATRDLLNIASRKMLADHPLGIGWNNYGLVINKPWHYGDHIDKWMLDHNAGIIPGAKGISESHYYLLLAENGYPGFISYILFISLFLFWNIRAAWKFRHSLVGCISFGILLGCAMNYTQSTLERCLTQPRNMILWMMLLALTSRIESWRRLAKKGQWPPAASGEQAPPKRRRPVQHERPHVAHARRLQRM